MGKSLAEMQIVLEASYDKLTSGLKGAGRELEQFASDGKRKIQTTDDAFTALLKGIKANEAQIKALGASMVAAGATMAAGIGVAVKQFADFESSIARAVGAAGGGAGDFKVFGDAAKNMARELGAGGVTAKGAADALFSIASAGLKGADAVNVLRPALTLAAATQSDMAQTTEAVIATLTQFGLATTETSRVTNVFAAANQQSLGSVTGFMEAMKQAGPTANMMGKSLEEAAAAAAILFNSGLKAEQVGTGLRNVMLKLLDPSKEATDALAAYGVTIADIDPRTKSLAQIVDVFRQKQIDATAITKVFGLENAVAFEALRKTGGDALTEMQRKLTGTSAATEQLRVQMETGSGALKNMRTQAELVGIEMGERFLEKLKPAISGVADWTKAISQADGATKDFVAVLGVVGAAGSLIGGMTLLGIATIPRVIDGLKLLYLAALPISAGFVAIAAAIVAASEAWRIWHSLTATGAARAEVLKSREQEIQQRLSAYDARFGGDRDLARRRTFGQVTTLEKELAAIAAERAAQPRGYNSDLLTFERASMDDFGVVGGTPTPKPSAGAGAPAAGNAADLNREIEAIVKKFSQAGLSELEQKLQAVRLAMSGASAELIAWAETMVIATDHAERLTKAAAEQAQGFAAYEEAASQRDHLADQLLAEANAHAALERAELAHAQSTTEVSAASKQLNADVSGLSREWQNAQAGLNKVGREGDLAREAFIRFGAAVEHLTDEQRVQLERYVDLKRAMELHVETSRLVARGYTQEQAAAVAASERAVRERQKQRIADGDYFGFVQGQFALIALQGPTVWEGLTSVVQSAAQHMTSAMSDFLFNFITGTATAAETFVNFGKAMLRTITDFLAQQAVKTFLSFLFGGSGGFEVKHTGGLVGSAATMLSGGGGGLLGGNTVATLLEKGEAVFSKETWASVKDFFGLGDGPSGFQQFKDLMAGGGSGIVDSVGSWISANPGLAAGGGAAVIGAALQMSGNADAARAGQLLTGLSPIIGGAVQLGPQMLAGITGGASTALAGFGAEGAAMAMLATEATAAGAAGAGTAGAGLAGMGAAAGAGLAMAWVMLPSIIGPLLSGRKGEKFDLLENEGLHRLGASIASGATPSIEKIREAIAQGTLTDVLATDWLSLRAAVANTGAGGPLSLLANWMDGGTRIEPVSDPLAKLLNPQNIPNWNPLQSGHVDSSGNFRTLQEDIAAAVQLQALHERLRAEHEAFGLPGPWMAPGSFDIPGFKTGLDRVPGPSGEPWGPVMLHAGERVLTEAQADAQDRGAARGPRVHVAATFTVVDPDRLSRETRRRWAKELAGDVDAELAQLGRRRTSSGSPGRG